MKQPTRRQLLERTATLLAAALVSGSPARLLADDLAPLDVASAGSFRSMLDGPLKTAAAQTLKLDLRSHSMGADTVAHALVDGTLRADVFIPVTLSPMQILFAAGRAQIAHPIAGTELVLVYSPKSRFLAQFEAAAQGKANWWQILQQPGLRIARSNPAADPSGRAIIFAFMLAAKKYNQPGLAEKILGPTLNPDQISTGGDTQARLQSGEIDVIASYRTGAEGSNLPYLVLPPEINLSRPTVRAENPEIHLTVGDKTFYPEPLIFYAAALTNAANPTGANAFINWLASPEAKTILADHHFNLPAEVRPARAGVTP